MLNGLGESCEQAKSHEGIMGSKDLRQEALLRREIGSALSSLWLNISVEWNSKMKIYKYVLLGF